jgi:hypothetical protein
VKKPNQSLKQIRLLRLLQFQRFLAHFFEIHSNGQKRFVISNENDPPVGGEFEEKSYIQISSCNTLS